MSTLDMTFGILEKKKPTWLADCACFVAVCAASLVFATCLALLTVLPIAVAVNDGIPQGWQIVGWFR